MSVEFARNIDTLSPASLNYPLRHPKFHSFQTSWPFTEGDCGLLADVFLYDSCTFPGSEVWGGQPRHMPGPFEMDPKEAVVIGTALSHPATVGGFQAPSNFRIIMLHSLGTFRSRSYPHRPGLSDINSMILLVMILGSVPE